MNHGGFIEQFENPYYEPCREKHDGAKSREALINKEKAKQTDRRSRPSQGFFTSKIAKNPNLFESKQHLERSRSGANNNWVLSDKNARYFSNQTDVAVTQDPVAMTVANIAITDREHVKVSSFNGDCLSLKQS